MTTSPQQDEGNKKDNTAKITPIQPMTDDLMANAPKTLANLKRMKNQDKFQKAKFGIKLYPIND